METIDKILEELRSGEYAPLANRIEEAVKSLIADRDNWRKQALAEDARANETQSVGNAAAMREALRNADIVLSQTSNGYHSPVRQEIKAALSAPPRNCDKYLTPKDAMLAHLDEVYQGEKVEFGDYEWCEFIKWLFAEAKGDAK